MASIDEIILRSINPFDNISSTNFWHKQVKPEPTVESIHQEAIATIEAVLDQVATDHCTRTVILDGDAGCGKTYLLGRVKKKFNNKAFFVYIPPFPSTDCIWRHILRYTVDSLVQIPEGQKDSQLLLWLNNVLSAIKERGFKERILKDDIFDLLRSDRRKFIRTLRSTYQQAGIYNADNFFGVLHDLTDSELYPSACDWLRGDDLSEESLKDLKVGKSIDTEEAARETLANFSRIAGDTQPIVLCFDQLNNIPRLSDGSLALQSLFDIITKIRDEDRNFLVIISINTDIWNKLKNQIDQSNKDRIERQVSLKPIDVEQAKSLLASRLYLLHSQANPQPNPIYPLVREHLEAGFPGGKTNPREAIFFGMDVFQQYKQWIGQGGTWKTFKPSIGKIIPIDLVAAFKLKWREELTKVQQRITQIHHLSSPELIQMLKEALAAFLPVENIKTPLFTATKFASYSLGYQLPGKPIQLGVVWTEDPNMTTFYHVMQACKKAVDKEPSLTLYLIRARAEKFGNSNNKGYQLYLKSLSHRHIKPNLTSVHYLDTYYSLVKDAREGDLVIGGQILVYKSLQELTREAKVLHDCPLLQDLGIVKLDANGQVKVKIDPKNREKVVIVDPKEVIESKDYLLNLIKTQHFMGRQALINKVHEHFNKVSELQVEEVIKELCQEKIIEILDPKSSPEAQLICLVPQK